MPEIIDPIFAKTRPKRSFSMTENELFGFVFANTGSINSGTGYFYILPPRSSTSTVDFSILYLRSGYLHYQIVQWYL